MAQSQSLYDILDQFLWHRRSWEDIKGMSFFSKVNYTNFFMLVFFVGFAIIQAKRGKSAQDNSPAKRKWLPYPDFPDIEELPNFSWKDEEPLKLRAFKPKYHLTMDPKCDHYKSQSYLQDPNAPALQKLNPSELVLMDKNYVDRIEFHKRILREHHNICINVNNDDRVKGAVKEHYNWLLSSYLPKRYPSMFKLHFASFETGSRYMLENIVTKAILPAQAGPNPNTVTMLENLGKTFDEDFLFLVPEDAEEGKEGQAKYILEAALCFCPSGWNPQKKIGLRLADIHTPVPGYSKLLEGSMDRYFSKLEVGDYVKRSNWMITTNGELCSYSESNHAYAGDKVEELKELDVDNTYLRCERQTLHRLPKSKAIVFAFKTYQYPIKQLKDEGYGEELAQAIDGLREGNVPEMNFYKRGTEWGEAMKRYLRS